MKQITTTVPQAGELRGFVSPVPRSARLVTRRAIMTAVRQTRKSFGLTTGDVLVLNTLLSFLPCRDKATGVDRPVSDDMILIVYASNTTICSRANGMDERVLRRHIARLRGVGLINRKDSATGKRFPLRRDGQVRDAYGIDLSPLLLRYPELAAEAERLSAQAEEIRSLRAEALTLRAELLRSVETLNDEARSFVEGVKTILRRTTLSVKQVAGLIRDMLQIGRGQTEIEASEKLVAATCPTPDPVQPEVSLEAVSVKVGTVNESAGDGQNVRQVESQKIDPDKGGASKHRRLLDVWVNCPNIASLCPDAIQSPSRLREAVFMFGSFFGLKPENLADGVTRIGWIHMLHVLEYLAENADRIKSPQGYFKAMIEGYASGKTVAGMR